MLLSFIVLLPIGEIPKRIAGTTTRITAIKLCCEVGNVSAERNRLFEAEPCFTY